MRIFQPFAVAAFVLMSATHAPSETLTLGSVNDNVRKHVDRFTPLAEYLADELADSGITSVEISVVPNSEAMVAAIRNGDVDLYFDSPLVAALVASESDAIPFLRRWKRGVAEYHSVVIVPTDSPLMQLDDLIGHRIGFQEPDSTSGFLLPAGMMRRSGLSLNELSDRSVQPPSDVVGYVFTGDDENTVLWLAKGWIDAAATDPRGFETLENARPGQYRILAQSIDVPRQVIVRSSNMSDALAEEIRRVLIHMVSSQRGIEVMEAFHKTTQFDDFPDGVEETFAPIYEILAELRDLGLI